MCARVLSLGLAVMFMLLISQADMAQQPEVPNLSVGKGDRWQTDVVSLFGDNWYFRLTIGALANAFPGPLQPMGFAHLTLGLSWTPELLISPQIRVTKAVHEISLRLEGVGDRPIWLLEITPFTFDFEINLPSSPVQAASSASRAQQPTAHPDQQVSLDLKALVLSRLDDLFKANEQASKEIPGLDPSTLRDPLNDFKKAFEAGKMNDAIIQLDIVSITLLVAHRSGFMPKLQEAHLRAGLHRLVSAFALYREQVQRQAVKICTGLFVSEDQKSEEVLSPLLTEMMKKLTFTNRTTGAKETFTLKESKCY